MTASTWLLANIAAINLILLPGISSAQTVDPEEAWKRASSCAVSPVTTDHQKPSWYSNVNSNTIFIFVHGIFSNNRDAWLADNCSYFPKLIADTFPEASVYLGGFYTSPSSGSYDAIDAAELLFDRLRDAVDGHSQRALDRPQLIFVAHSTGGLVVRQMLSSHPQAFSGKKLGLVLLASPTRGSAWADIAKPIAKFAGNHLAMQLQPESEFLKTLDVNFQNFMNVRSESNPVAGMEIIEQKFIASCWLCWSWEWTVVDRDSAAVYFKPPKTKPNANHFEVAKPLDVDDDTFKWTKSFYIDQFREKSIVLNYAPGNMARLTATYFLPKNKHVATFLQPLELTLPDARYCAPAQTVSGETHPRIQCVIALEQTETADGYKIAKTTPTLEPLDAGRNALHTALESESTKVKVTVVLQPRASEETWRFRINRAVQALIGTDNEKITIPAKEYKIGDEVVINFPEGAQGHRLSGTIAGNSIDVSYGTNDSAGWLTWVAQEIKMGGYAARWKIKRPYLN